MGFPFLLPAPRFDKCTREYRTLYRYFEDAAPPVSSFRAKARNLFRLRSGKEARMTDKGKHRTLCDVGTRCFMQTALRRKTERGNEKDPSAALGMTKRGKATSHFFSFRYGSQPPPLRGTSFQRKEGDTRMPFSPYRHFERKREIFFVRDRSGKVRTADNGKHRIPSDFILGAVFPQKVSRRFAFFAAL